jgi:hypothetical protein
MAFLEVKFFFQQKKNHPSEGQFFKNDKMCNSYESRSVSARAESYKKVRKQIKKKKFYLPMFFGIRDPRSGIRDGKKSGSGIRDKHPGSATLPFSFHFSSITSCFSHRSPHFSYGIFLLPDTNSLLCGKVVVFVQYW